MLNLIRVVVVILGVVALVIIVADACDFVNLKMNNTVKTLVYTIFVICSIFFSLDGFIIWYKSR